jgi:hypothetical protein
MLSYFKLLHLRLKMAGFIRDILDQRKAQLIFQISLPELLVVVDVRLEVRID